jgi:Holliday junction DNA helicase RuvA
MITTLHGTVSERVAEVVVIDVSGVGYGVYMTNEDQGRVSGDQDIKLYVYEHIREQSHDLFGFLSLDTKSLFEQLLGVNGVGPKMALSVLSVGTSSEVRQAIASGDTKMIQRASGVGKRVAERVVVDLKDKVGLVSVDLQMTDLLQGTAMAMADEAVEALVVLGYSIADATKALQHVDPELPTEERIKLALSQQY